MRFGAALTRTRHWYALVAFALLVACGAPAAAPAKPPAASGSALAAPPAPAGGAPAAPPAASAPASGSVQPLQPAVSVKAGAYELSGNAGLFVAFDRGYFRDEGLDVELVDVRNTPDQIPMLATGEMHVGVGVLDPAIFNAVARDIPLKIAAPVSVTKPEERGLNGLVVRKDLVDSGQYTSLKDVKGHTIARPFGGGVPPYYVDWIIRTAGLTPADLQPTIMTFPDMLPAFGNKAIDSAILVEPFVSIAQGQGTIVGPVVTLNEMVPNLSTLVLMMSPVFAREQPEAAKRFVTAWLRGQRDYGRVTKDEAARAEIVDILVKYLPIKDPNVLTRTLNDSVTPNGELDEAVLDDMQGYFVQIGSQSQRVELSRIIDRTYLDYALGRLGRVQ
jgi:NitT/TauT family transport system substrate-binding protein